MVFTASTNKMKTYRIYTPWNSLTVEATNEKQAKIQAVRQLLHEIKTMGVDVLDAEVEDATEDAMNDYNYVGNRMHY